MEVIAVVVGLYLICRPSPADESRVRVRTRLGAKTVQEFWAGKGEEVVRYSVSNGPACTTDYGTFSVPLWESSLLAVTNRF